MWSCCSRPSSTRNSGPPWIRPSKQSFREWSSYSSLSLPDFLNRPDATGRLITSCNLERVAVDRISESILFFGLQSWDKFENQQVNISLFFWSVGLNFNLVILFDIISHWPIAIELDGGFTANQPLESLRLKPWVQQKIPVCAKLKATTFTLPTSISLPNEKNWGKNRIN